MKSDENSTLVGELNSRHSLLMRISLKQYAQILYELTEGKTKSEIENSVADFARYLCKERKLKIVGKILEQFENIYNKKKGIVEAEVISARKLEDSQVRKLKDFIKRKHSAKEVSLKNTIDKSIKGGIILKIGDEIVDGSIRGKLSALKDYLVN